MIYVALPGINPVPWKAPLANWSQRQFYKPDEVMAFQEAVREEVQTKLTDGRYEAEVFKYLVGPLTLRFWFWRRLDLGVSAHTKARRRGHQSDTTNMQKALEDALHGVVFDNDREVKDIRSVTVDQGPDVRPGIVIGVDVYYGAELLIPSHILNELLAVPQLTRVEHDPNVDEVF